jgi:hypothetical protein
MEYVAYGIFGVVGLLIVSSLTLAAIKRYKRR